MIDQYFAADLEFRNHSVAKNYSLDQIKMSVLEVHKKFNLSVDGDRVFKLVAAIILQVLVTSVLAFGGGLFWVE
ncbi:MAG: hypothetical protein NTV32_03105 [Gammaproteobacteria bacterium]|nr:hypothetical protein [Gammaproteobacteria bacterium]